MTDNAGFPPPPKRRLEVDWSSAEIVWLPDGQSVDGELRRAMVALLPPGVSMGYSQADGRRCVQVSRPADTRAVLNSALAQLGRPTVELPDRQQGRYRGTKTALPPLPLSDPDTRASGHHAAV